MAEEEMREKRVRTVMNTDADSTQSIQKKGQMKSIFLSDSDKEAIVEFIKQHKELYDKTNTVSKTSRRKKDPCSPWSARCANMSSAGVGSLSPPPMSS